ncbi:MAG: hypothetical protein JJE46_05515 [Acidimicrobiia bacterium]|nr:hypothetical protein [Acidimicrobiia bacterium]
MPLPVEVGSHHTVWVHPPGGVAHPVRYAVDGDRLVCFGDGILAAVPDGTHVSASIHEIAGGQAVAAFGASFCELAPESVGADALLELLAHVPMGRDLDEVETHIEQQRADRRIVALVP